MESADAQLLNWLTLSLTPGLGSAGARRLLEVFGTPGRIFAASGSELEEISGLRASVRTALLQKEAAAEAEQELARAEREEVAILTWDDSAFPDLLRRIHDPPLLLYVKGKAEWLAHPGIAVVGARAATSYGRQMAENFAFQLARKGLSVISGFALGIDTAAHWGALRAPDGRTIGVLGSGLSVIYPSQNRKLFDKIAETGTLVSEYPLRTKPDGFRFPARNRIISGLALGILVVEAARQSGSLITARQALEQGREVFAVPGRIDSWKSEGTHRLLQEGAKLVFRVEDILEELPAGILGPSAASAQRDGEPAAAPPLDPQEQQLLAALDVYPKTIDELIQETTLPAGKVSELLLILELKQLIVSLPGKQYQRNSLSSA